MMHQAVGLVPSEKGTAEQVTTFGHNLHHTPLLSLVNNDTGKNRQGTPNHTRTGTHTAQNHPHTNTNAP